MTGTTGTYSNSNNVRGWIAIDYFPSVNMSTNKPYISLEFTALPERHDVNKDPRAGVQRIG